MAPTLKSAMTIYDPRTQVGFREGIDRVINAFNAATNGAIRMTTTRRAGEYAREALVDRLSGLIRRRDSASNAVVADINLSQSEHVSVKLDRGIGPVSTTLDALSKPGIVNSDNPQEFEDWLMFAIGAQAAEDVMANGLDAALLALRVALNSSADTLHDVSGAEDLTSVGLSRGLHKLGDKAADISFIVMHSDKSQSLLEDQITQNIDGLTSGSIIQGTVATFNKPVLVVDSPSLIDGAGKYHTLCLTNGAATVEDTEGERVLVDAITGTENLGIRIQGEYSINLGLKGFTWDDVNGGKNPDDTAIGTAGNWDGILQSHKSGPGSVVKSD